MKTPQAPILSVEKLSIRFGSSEVQPAVDQISFDLEKGKTLAIVGESGSGKSVSSLAIMGLLPSPPAFIEAGKLTWKGNTPLLSLSDEELQKMRGKAISMIFQEPMTSLNPVMRCGRQVAEMLAQHFEGSPSSHREAVLSLFEKVQLPDPARIWQSYPHELSGGQKQRVMIAMALACKPDLIIADEPTTALDVTVQKTILELLKSLQAEYGMAMIFITHDLGVVKQIADEVMVMFRGKLIEKGSIEDILQRPKEKYTKGLLACKPDPNNPTARLATVEDFLSEYNVQNEPKLAPTLFKEKLIEVRDLDKTFGKAATWLQKDSRVRAVKGVSFDIFKGETLGLVGESGCGKTTLSRALLRLVEPSSGSIAYKGEDILGFDANALKKWRKKAQIIFQDPYSSLNPKISIGEAIAEPMRIHLGTKAEMAEQKTRQLLDKVGLNGDQFHRFPHEFSGGQRQRIVIARTLALSPEFIICDESVSALDVSVQAQVLNLLNDLKQEYGLTYLFISHDLSVIKHMSDRILVMNKGAIEEIGTADEIFFHPKQSYTQKLLAAIPN